MTFHDETRIIVCPRCDLRTRYRREAWQRPTLLSWLTGRTRMVEGWRCTKCGHRRGAR